MYGLSACALYGSSSFLGKTYKVSSCDFTMVLDILLFYVQLIHFPCQILRSFAHCGALGSPGVSGETQDLCGVNADVQKARSGKRFEVCPDYCRPHSVQIFNVVHAGVKILLCTAILLIDSFH